MNEDGLFSFIELKVLRGKPGGHVDISSHQTAWLSRHDCGSVFICVRDRTLSLLVYAGSAAVDLRLCRSEDVPPLEVFEKPYDWKAFFQLTCPR